MCTRRLEWGRLVSIRWLENLDHMALARGKWKRKMKGYRVWSVCSVAVSSHAFLFLPIKVPCLLQVTSQLEEDCRMSFVRFVFLIPWTTFVACVRMKHYTLRVAAPSPTWDSRQQLIVNLSKFKTSMNMIRTYIVFSILRHVINVLSTICLAGQCVVEVTTQHSDICCGGTVRSPAARGTESWPTQAYDAQFL